MLQGPYSRDEGLVSKLCLLWTRHHSTLLCRAPRSHLPSWALLVEAGQDNLCVAGLGGQPTGCLERSLDFKSKWTSVFGCCQICWLGDSGGWAPEHSLWLFEKFSSRYIQKTVVIQWSGTSWWSLVCFIASLFPTFRFMCSGISHWGRGAALQDPWTLWLASALAGGRRPGFAVCLQGQELNILLAGFQASRGRLDLAEGQAWGQRLEPAQQSH